MLGEASVIKMPHTAKQRKEIYAERKARAEKGLLTPKELEMKEKNRLGNNRLEGPVVRR